VSQGIQRFVKCVCLVDEYGNYLSSNRGIDPILEIVRLENHDNQMDHGEELQENNFKVIARIPVSASASTVSGKKRAHQEELNPLEFRIDAISQEIVDILDNELLPLQTIGVRVKNDQVDVSPSELETFVLTVGLPHILLISTAEHRVTKPCTEATITTSRRSKLNGIKLHVFDKFGNELKLGSNFMSTLTIYQDNKKVHTTQKRANLLLQDSVLVPDVIWRTSSTSFSLRFEMEVSKTTCYQLIPAQLHCNVFVANNVIGVELFSDSLVNGEVHVPAGSCMPVLTVKLVTEDDKPCPMATLQSFDVQIWEMHTDGPRLMNFNYFYSNQLVPLGHGRVRFEPTSQPRNTAPVSYKIEIVYVEIRGEMEILRPSSSIMIHVHPGEPKTLLLSAYAKNRLRDVACVGGDIGTDVRLDVKDKLGNEIALVNNYILTCRAINSGEAQVTVPILVVETAHQPSEVHFLRIGLAGRDVNNGVLDGNYLLLFALEDRQGNILLQNSEFSFHFTSTNTYNSQAEKLRKQMEPFQKQIQRHVELENELQKLRQKEKQAFDALRLSTADRAAAEHRRLEVENKISSIEMNQRSALRVKKVTSNLDLELQRAIGNDVLGRVVDLALVKERKYVHILSLACKASMEVVVCKDSNAVHRMWDAGFNRCVPLDMVTSFRSRTQSSLNNTVGELPLDKIEMRNPKNPNSRQLIEPPGNPKYLVSK
jgi:hypothetical protein